MNTNQMQTFTGLCLILLGLRLLLYHYEVRPSVEKVFAWVVYFAGLFLLVT